SRVGMMTESATGDCPGVGSSSGVSAWDSIAPLSHSARHAYLTIPVSHVYSARPISDPNSIFRLSRLGRRLRCDRRFLPLFPQLVGLVLLLQGVVELPQPLQGFGQKHPSVRGDPGLALLEALVALDEQWLSLEVLPLTQQAATEQRLHVEGVPFFRLRLLED